MQAVLSNDCARPPTHDAVGTMWAFRAHNELQAAAQFRAMAEDLALVDAPQVVIDMARQAADDEDHHFLLCARAASRFGHPVIERPTVVAKNVVDPGVPLRVRVLARVVAMSVITETLSTALLREMRKRTTDRELRQTIHAILKDEIGHARLGWAYLAAGVGRREANWVARNVPQMLRDTVREELFNPGSSDDVGQLLETHGALSRAVRKQLFIETMEMVVFPGLDAMGINSSHGRIWLSGVA